MHAGCMWSMVASIQPDHDRHQGAAHSMVAQQKTAHDLSILAPFSFRCRSEGIQSELADELGFRLSLTYQPDPLNTIPGALKSR